MRYFTWKLELVSNILQLIVSRGSFFDSNSSQTLLNLISWKILLTLRLWQCFNLEIRQLICKIGQNLLLLDNCFSDPFRWEIITYKHGIYEFAHEFSNSLRLRIFKNKEIFGKCLNSMEWYPGTQAPCQYKNFGSASKRVPKNSD